MVKLSLGIGVPKLEIQLNTLLYGGFVAAVDILLGLVWKLHITVIWRV